MKTQNTMNATHTPGPWRTGTRIVKSNGWPAFDIYPANGGPFFATCSFYSPSNADANVHLIAAAPEMLEALEMLITTAEANGWAHDMPKAMQRARAIIARAKGVES